MRSGYCGGGGLKRDKVVKISRLSGCKNFVGERSLYSMASNTIPYSFIK